MNNPRGTTLQDGGLVSGDRVNNSGFEEALFGRYRAMPVTCKTIRQRISRQELPALPFSKVDSVSAHQSTILECSSSRIIHTLLFGCLHRTNRIVEGLKFKRREERQGK